MKTYNLYFRNFKKNCSFDNLFFTKEYRKKANKIACVFIFLSLLIILPTDIYALSNINNPISYKIIFPLLFLGILPYFIGRYAILPFMVRKELKKYKKPIPNKFYFWRWKSDELIDLRILEINKKYSSERTEVIDELINMTKELINEPVKNGFLVFEKYMIKVLKVSIPIITSIFITFLTYALYKDYITKEFINLELGIYFFIIFSIFFIGYIAIRNTSLGRISDYKKELKEYAYILKNIRLLRLQESKPKNQ